MRRAAPHETTSPCLGFLRRHQPYLSSSPDRRHPHGTEYIVPLAGIHPKDAPCYHLDSYIGAQPATLANDSEPPSPRKPMPPDLSATFKALSQEWVRVPSGRSSHVGYHRWLYDML